MRPRCPEAAQHKYSCGSPAVHLEWHLTGRPFSPWPLASILSAPGPPASFQPLLHPKILARPWGQSPQDTSFLHTPLQAGCRRPPDGLRLELREGGSPCSFLPKGSSQDEVGGKREEGANFMRKKAH